MKKLVIIAFAAVMFMACNNKESESTQSGNVVAEDSFLKCDTSMTTDTLLILYQQYVDSLYQLAQLENADSAVKVMRQLAVKGGDISDILQKRIADMTDEQNFAYTQSQRAIDRIFNGGHEDSYGSYDNYDDGYDTDGYEYGDPVYDDGYPEGAPLEMTLSGKLGKFPIEMYLYVADNYVALVRYRYTATGSGEWIELTPLPTDNDMISIAEFHGTDLFGIFSGDVSRNGDDVVYSGIFTIESSGKTMNFEVSGEPQIALD